MGNYGATREALTKSQILELPVPIPAMPVQDRLTWLIDSARRGRSSALAHLALARRQIDRFRQAVLAAACSGRLTADWREANPPGESAESIVIAIDEARRDRLGRRYRPSSPPDLESDLPDGWSWTIVGALVDVATGATPLRKRSDYYNGTIPWVTSGAVNVGLIETASEFITDAAIRETTRRSSLLAPSSWRCTARDKHGDGLASLQLKQRQTRRSPLSVRRLHRAAKALLKGLLPRELREDQSFIVWRRSAKLEPGSDSGNNDTVTPFR